MAVRIRRISEMLVLITLFINIKNSILINTFLCCRKITHGHSCYALCVGPGCNAISHVLDQDARCIGLAVWLTCEPTDREHVFLVDMALEDFMQPFRTITVRFTLRNMVSFSLWLAWFLFICIRYSKDQDFLFNSFALIPSINLLTVCI